MKGLQGNVRLWVSCHQRNIKPLPIVQQYKKSYLTNEENPRSISSIAKLVNCNQKAAK